MKEVVDAQVRDLKDEFNVICFHQQPCSPATNMLDLDFCMALQDVIDKKCKEAKAFCDTVKDAWEKLDPVKLRNVYTA